VGHYDKEEKKLSDDEDGDPQHIDDLEEANGEEDELELMLKMEGLDDDEDGNHSKVIKGSDGEVLGIDVSLSAPTLKEVEPTIWNKTITDKEFYKAMQKLKDRGTNAVPPKKSASAYIIFGKEVSSFPNFQKIKMEYPFSIIIFMNLLPYTSTD
jgi:hypothetical protein